MNCKPGQMAMIVRASACEPCSARKLGLPTTVSHLSTAVNRADVIQEVLEGPVWVLAEPLPCPFGISGCLGIAKLPDACLRPFDPESEPVPEAEAEDLGRPVTVEFSPLA